MNRRKFLKYLSIGSSALAALPFVAKSKEIKKYSAKDYAVSVGGKEVVGFADANEFTIDNIKPCLTESLLHSKLLALTGVTEVEIIENNIIHTIECVVRGGKDLDIATCIYYSKPLAVATTGSHYYNVSKIYNQYSIIRFSRFSRFKGKK